MSNVGANTRETRKKDKENIIVKSISRRSPTNGYYG